MSACEWCWAEASRRAMLMGGSTGDHYSNVLAEQQEMGPSALCPEVRREGGTTMLARVKEIEQRLDNCGYNGLDEDDARWLIAEIRRLREEVTSMDVRISIERGQKRSVLEAWDKSHAALAAHQAVVRELAKASEKYIAEGQANLRAAQSTVPGPPEPPRWAALQHLQSWLDDPLVQQAREEKV